MAVSHPLTIGTVRDQHLSLMREWRELPRDHDRIERASEMRRLAAAAGENIESPAERDEAQGIIDYWASAMAGLEGHAYPDLISVAAYASTQAASASKSVREVYEGLQPNEAQRIARSVLEELFILGERGVERDRPRTREALRRNSGSGDAPMFDRVLDGLVETGAIVRRPSESHDEDCFEAVDGRIAESWPTLQEWLEAAKTYNSERSHLMEQAQQWSAAKKDPTLLLVTSRAVEKALAYRGEDDLLDEYIEASRASRSRLRHLLQTLSIIGIVLLAGALVYYISIVKQERAARETAEKKLAEALHLEARAKVTNQEANRKNEEATANAETAKEPDALSTSQFARVVRGISPATPGFSESPLAGLPILSGAMWLGSDEAAQVADLQGGVIGPLSRAVPGTRYRARVQIYLRSAMPKSATDYQPAKEKAVIPAGAQIVLLSKPRGFKRATGLQYWADVRVVPQVYVQYNNILTRDIDEIRRQIAEAGFEVPAGEARTDYRNHAELRYLQPADAPIARVLQKTLNAIPSVTRSGKVDCKLFAGSPSGGTNFKLEFWFDARRRPVQVAHRPCR